jgi:hypothetical protein
MDPGASPAELVAQCQALGMQVVITDLVHGYLLAASEGPAVTCGPAPSRTVVGTGPNLAAAQVISERLLAVQESSFLGVMVGPVADGLIDRVGSRVG